MKKNIRDLSFEELSLLMLEMGEPRHRSKQISKWLYRKNALSFSEMTDLPKRLTEKLEKKFSAGGLVERESVVSRDGTEKFLWSLKDDVLVESVLIPAKERTTVCVSSQAGCRFRCPFCASGTDGFTRNLTCGEIVAQVIMMRRAARARITNVVFMGMGEPMDNFDNVAGAIKTINHPEGIGIAGRKITVSTCGIVPGIRKLKDLGIQVELSVSLHAAEDKLRDKLVPANRKYPLRALIPCLRDYFDSTGRVVTLEYALIKGMNDSLSDSDSLAAVAKGLNAKVNLIRCNVSDRSGYEASPVGIAEIFRERLASKGVKVTMRRPRGADIFASCGQLAAKRLSRDTEEGGK